MAEQQYEITFRGVTTTPSDYSCPDGDLDVCTNMILEDGELRPLQRPKQIGFLPTDWDLLYIHKNSISLDENIYYRGGGEVGTRPGDIDGYKPDVFYTHPKGETPSKVLAMGETLILSYSDGLVFCLHEAMGVYRVLGSGPMQLNLGFGLKRTVKRADCKLTFSEEGDASKLGMTSTGELSKKGQAELNQQFWEDYYNVIDELRNVYDDAIFMHPFFMRYAYRINTDAGVHTLHSAPVLMIPSSKNVAYVKSVNDPKGNEEKSVAYDILITHGQLYYTIQNSLEELQYMLSAWKDIITEVDIFISAPISDIKQGGEVIDSIKAEDDDSYILPVTPSNDGVLPFREVYNSLKKGEDVVVPLFANVYNDSYYWPKVYIDIPKYSKEEMRERYTNASLFYKAATFKIAELADKRAELDDNTEIKNGIYPTYPISLPISKELVNSLEQREVLEDDFDSHCALKASTILTYNARLYLANVKKSLFPGYYPESLFARQWFDSGQNTPGATADYTYEVYTQYEINGEKIVTRIESDHRPSHSIDYLPFVYVPDTRAKKLLVITYKNGVKLKERVYTLTPHNMLNGAYYFNDLALTDGEQRTEGNFIILKVSNAKTTFIPTPNQIMASEVNTPFHFPITGREYVGYGEIRAMAPVSVALSQGQFGDFPLYVFTDEGIWAMSIGADGRIMSKQPATRDVINSPNSLLQMDGELAFTTDEGLMVLSGAKSVRISLDDRPDNAGLDAALGLSPQVLIKHSNFFKGCSLAFDYRHKRIYAINGGYDLALVYSLKSQSWCTMGRYYPGGDVSFLRTVNDYPRSLIIGKRIDGESIAFDVCQETGVNMMRIVTRPIKLGNPDALKTITSLVHRFSSSTGNSRIDSFQLFGSNNGYDYIKVASNSRDHLRRLHGSPYKYFVLHIYLKQNWEVNTPFRYSGISIRYQTKWNNKLR